MHIGDCLEMVVIEGDDPELHTLAGAFFPDIRSMYLTVAGAMGDFKQARRIAFPDGWAREPTRTRTTAERPDAAIRNRSWATVGSAADVDFFVPKHLPRREIRVSCAGLHRRASLTVRASPGSTAIVVPQLVPQRRSAEPALRSGSASPRRLLRTLRALT